MSEEPKYKQKRVVDIRTGSKKGKVGRIYRIDDNGDWDTDNPVVVARSPTLKGLSRTLRRKGKIPTNITLRRKGWTFYNPL